jgi:hypothetical protein
MAEYLISERGRALIIAAAVLDRSNADPDDDIAVLARQLIVANEEIERRKEQQRYLVQNAAGSGLWSNLFG